METTTMLDLGPITRSVATLVAGVRDDQLSDPTPCTEYAVGDLVHHLAGLTVAFTTAARKEVPEGARRAVGDASRLDPNWRDTIRQDLAALALAWRHPAAYHGQTQAGGIDMSGAEAAVVGLNELVVHGWDLAVATGQEYDVAEAELAPCLSFAEFFSTPGTEEMRGDAFGPVIRVGADAPALDRLLGLMGRDPAWHTG
ncbi:MAG TPA: TIGR03086 family metal-binding protein [Nocardioides sp.]|jgi:uncharacterized protein (TIGR03086 family)